jgi:hypothetical protein
MISYHLYLLVRKKSPMEAAEAVELHLPPLVQNIENVLPPRRCRQHESSLVSV